MDDPKGEWTVEDSISLTNSGEGTGRYQYKLGEARLVQDKVVAVEVAAIGLGDAVGQEMQVGIAGDLIKAPRPWQRGRRYRLASTLGNAARLASPNPYSSLGLGDTRQGAKSR